MMKDVLMATTKSNFIKAIEKNTFAMIDHFKKMGAC